MAVVRRGLRREFWPARTPTVPKVRAYADRASSSSGRLSTGLAAETPSRMASTPAPTHHPPCGTSTTSPRPTTSASRPAPASATPSPNRRRSELSGSATSSRSACTGAMRAVRRAGSQAAAIVTTTPTAYAATTVRGAKISGCPRRSSPNWAKSARMAIASSTPNPRPTVDPKIPSTSASSCTERVTCRLEAPSARSSASSRERWATRIEKVLTMRKAPTTSAIPAKISRKVVRKPIAWRNGPAASSAASSPVTASKPGGSTRATRSASSSCETSSSAVTQIVLNAASSSRKSRWATGVAKSASVAPLSDPPSTKPATPTRRGSNRSVPNAVTIGTRSPTA
ncbi:unannotated protein [freshwater metagenome]|uniref:Unannotated protein n=1 Tax=freshwater metagenome TaxID=449393 RepID=A0A6J6QJ52_9ZZZZ